LKLFLDFNFSLKVFALSSLETAIHRANISGWNMSKNGLLKEEIYLDFKTEDIRVILITLV